MDNYLDFGIPISFGWTAQYLDTKTQTRRQWKDSHAAKFLRAYDRAAVAGQILRVPAIDKAYHAGGKQIGWCVIRDRPFKQRLGDMPESDLQSEGGMSATVADFIAKYFKGKVDLDVWVIDFQFVAMFEELPLDCDTGFQSSVDVDFVDHQLTQIALHGDEARWQLASHLKMFEVLSFDRTLTDVQRQAVDNFAIGWQIPNCECEGCDTSDEDAPVIVKSCCIPRQQPKSSTQFLEFDPEYDDANYNRELAFKRYLRLIESPLYRVDLAIDRFGGNEHLPPEQEQRGPKPKIPIEKDLPFPPNLDTSARKIGWGVRKKILAALAIWSLPRDEVVNVRTLFAEVKFRGFEYNQKSQTWEYQYRVR